MSQYILYTFRTDYFYFFLFVVIVCWHMNKIQALVKFSLFKIVHAASMIYFNNTETLSNTNWTV